MSIKLKKWKTYTSFLMCGAVFLTGAHVGVTIFILRSWRPKRGIGIAKLNAKIAQQPTQSSKQKMASTSLIPKKNLKFFKRGNQVIQGMIHHKIVTFHFDGKYVTGDLWETSYDIGRIIGE